MPDLISPQAVRGRITNLRTANFAEFLLNPTKIRVSKGVNISEDVIPGASDPLAHFASGKAKLIRFSIELSGELSLRRRGMNFTNAAQNDGAETLEGYGVDAEIELYESFQYPVDPALPGSDGGPDRVIFSFGRSFRGVICIVENVETERLEFTPSLQTSRATVDLSLRVWATTTTYADQVFAPPKGMAR